MSITYKLLDADGEEYELNGELSNTFMRGTTTYKQESFSIDNKIKEKSAGAGSVALGESRIEAREYTLTYERMTADEDAFRANENELIAFLTQAVYLVDVEANRRVPVRAKTISFKYADGGHKKAGAGSIKLTALNPFWEDITQSEVTGSISGGSQDGVSFEIGGYYKVQPIITITADAAVTALDIYVNTSDADDRVGITIEDTAFGLTDYETMIIDCEAGTIKIGDLDRSQFVEEGTGFFNIDVGSTEVIFNPTGGNIEVSITYRGRYFV